MKWEDCAVYDLKRYNSYKRSIENLSEKLEMLNMQIGQAKSPQFGGIGGKNGTPRSREDTLIDIIVEQDEIRQSIKIEKKKVAIIERGLASLEDEERICLDYFYINRTKDYIDKLIDMLHMERSSIYRLKDDALRQFTLECYGVYL